MWTATRFATLMRILLERVSLLGSGVWRAVASSISAAAGRRQHSGVGEMHGLVPGRERRAGVRVSALDAGHAQVRRLEAASGSGPEQGAYGPAPGCGQGSGGGAGRGD